MAAKQNEISHIYLGGSDLAQREQEVLEDACSKIGFTPKKIIRRSRWWTSKEIGAFFVSGTYKKREAVLKIQGVKPIVSESFMIKSFAKNNKSKLIRPPIMYTSLPWDNLKRYEALVLEEVEKRVVQTPSNKEELSLFFKAYQDYRKNCLNSPWLKKPKDTIPQRVSDNFKIWREASFKLFPTHPLRKENDANLIDSAVDVLRKGYENVDFEFQHGHFSEGDLYEKDGQIILLSNLYWAWRPPLYDAVFGMHWFIYHLAEVKNITSEKVDEQRNLWLSKIESLEAVKQNQKLYKLALLERAAAGLNLDALSVDFNLPISEFLVESTRKQVINLTKELG